ncbi:MAG TPA: efflux RND transporter periplasmic adaptor subunit [Gammaproteobacteria bacterium]|nr:efflux RND transporter periplasmic adaptor subunit [Gammaproteobacteria bacterium]
MLKKALAPILILVVAGSAAAAMVLNKRAPERKTVEETAIMVETLALESQDIRFTIASQGNVVPHTETTLVSEISSTVLKVSPKFVAGGFFRSGEVLLELDPADYEVAVQQSRANLLGMQARLTLEQAQADQAKKEWDMSGRARNRAPVLALRTPYLEEARANVLSAEADLKKAERKLALTRIRAPYDGMIKEKRVDIGQYVSTGTQLAITFAVDFAEVRLPLSDMDIANLDLPGPEDLGDSNNASGPEVTLSSTIGGREIAWSGRIVRTEGVIDQKNRVHYAVARITDPYCLNCSEERPPLAIGSFVKASIQGTLVQGVIAVPLQAIRGMDQLLLLDAEDRIRIQKVEVLRTDDTFAYIKDPSLVKQQAITTNIYNPVNGMKVQKVQDS